MNAFLGRKSRFLAKKSDFCHTISSLVNGPFLALGETVHFPPWDRFPRYSSFHKKPGCQLKKSPPSPLRGHRLPVTALALSARGLDKHPYMKVNDLCVYMILKTKSHVILEIPDGFSYSVLIRNMFPCDKHDEGKTYHFVFLDC